jgi:hypothetical protein
MSVEAPLKQLVTTDPRYFDMLTEEDEVWPVAFARPQRFNLSVNRLAMVLGSRTLWRLLSRAFEEVGTNRRAIGNSLVLYGAVRQAHGTPIVVDSTKNPARLKGFYLADPGHLRAIQLVRDGRAVCYSRMRREGLTMEECARVWKAEQRKQQSVTATMHRGIIIRVRYEDLCAYPRTELERLCKWFGISFSSRMLKLDRNDHHSVGGNPMRYRPIHGIRLDERWREELSQFDRHTFERIAGATNRRLGYA